MAEKVTAMKTSFLRRRPGTIRFSWLLNFFFALCFVGLFVNIMNNPNNPTEKSLNVVHGTEPEKSNTEPALPSNEASLVQMTESVLEIEEEVVEEVEKEVEKVEQIENTKNDIPENEVEQPEPEQTANTDIVQKVSLQRRQLPDLRNGGIVIFYHLPKTGGSSIMYSNFKE